MRRHRKPSDAPKSALFTFLDVLTCTMGLLILLLVAIAAQARNQAQALADASRTRNTAAEQQAWDEMHRQIESMRTAREQAAAALARRRATLEDLEDQSRRLADELAELEAARLALEKVLSGDPTAEHQADLRRLQARISEMQDRLAKARKNAATASESFAIVPYEGPNQTRRRPIYIECRADGVVLQPEGILLTQHDFEGPMGPGNPLAAGVRAAEQYLKRNQQSSQRESGEPYPMLLVRPDGIESYYAARNALRSWGADFGYELVDQEWKLDYKSPDAELVAVESRAVEEGRERQKEMIASIGGLVSRGGGGGRFRAAPGGGLTREGGNGGSLSSGDRPSFRVAPDGRIVRENAPRSSTSSSASRRGSFPGGGGKPLASKAGGDANGHDKIGDGPGNQESIGDELPPRSAQGGGLAGRGAGRTPSGTGEPSSGGVEELPPQQPLPSSSPRMGAARPAGELASAANPESQNNAATSSAAGGASGSKPAGAAASEPQSPFMRSTAQQSGSSGGGPPGMPGGQPSDAATASDQAPPLVLPQQIFGQRDPVPRPQSLADTHGKNWALPDASRGSFPVTRPIRIQCRADGMTLLPDLPGGQDAKNVPFGPKTATSMDALVTAVWERMDSWGIAGKGLYWRPELHLETTSDGEARREDLKALLANSGIAIYERPATVRAASR